MYISGNFKSIKDVDYQIVITDGDMTKDVRTIGEEGYSSPMTLCQSRQISLIHLIQL